MAYSPNAALVLGGDREYDEPVSPQTLISDMVQFDMGSQSFVNSTAQCCNATGGIERGAMQYVPTFGPEGMFIAMGGLNGLTYNTTNGLIGLSTVSVYDPAKQEWWNQTTSGNAPSPRVSFCTAGINSTNGTYEMYARCLPSKLLENLLTHGLASSTRAMAGSSGTVLFSMIQSTFSHCPHSTGSAYHTHPNILDSHILAMQSEEARFSPSEALTPGPRRHSLNLRMNSTTLLTHFCKA